MAYTHNNFILPIRLVISKAAGCFSFCVTASTSRYPLLSLQIAMKWKKIDDDCDNNIYKIFHQWTG